MTLRSKLALRLSWLILSLLLISGASLWGLNGLHQDLGLAVAGYQDLRQLYEVGSHLATARTLLGVPQPARPAVLSELRSAQTKLDLLITSHVPSILSPDQMQRLGQVKKDLADAVRRQSAAEKDEAFADDSADLSAIRDMLGKIASAAAQVRQAIVASERAADDKRHTTERALTILAAAVIAIALVTGIWQYRGIARPLQQLGRGVRTIAAGRFTERIESHGSDELAALAHDFNRMAGELDTLYRELEQKVAQKSRELVRSERLASVGYLAAGVAHEINNPLSIITGYAELSLKRLSEHPQSGTEDARKTLALICEEAFRCKQIIEKLLALARPGEAGRKKIALDAVAESVVTLVRGLPQLGARQLELRIAGDDSRIAANEGEIKQVLLNLILNAIDATPPAGGRIDLEIARDDQWVQLTVSDNGRGMSPDVLERIFEPFFTTRRGDGATEPRGTGLGLPIAHAIIESHGGRVEAASEGPGKGSRFTLRLPAVP